MNNTVVDVAYMTPVKYTGKKVKGEKATIKKNKMYCLVVKNNPFYGNYPTAWIYDTVSMQKLAVIPFSENEWNLEANL